MLLPGSRQDAWCIPPPDIIRVRIILRAGLGFFMACNSLRGVRPAVAADRGRSAVTTRDAAAESGLDYGFPNMQ